MEIQPQISLQCIEKDSLIMTDKDTGPIKFPNQTTLYINVTELTQNQRHELFKYAMSLPGFTGFVKDQDYNNNQLHYAFYYYDEQF